MRLIVPEVVAEASVRQPLCCWSQVRQLREELLAARRDRAVEEAREAELRRELSSLKRQVGGWLTGVAKSSKTRLTRLSARLP